MTTFTINVFAMLLLTREFVRYAQGRPAKILNIASTAGITSRPGWVAYAASKAAVVSLSQTLADELAGTGIKVYSISPGRTATELRRILAPDEDPTQDHAAERRRRRDRLADARRGADARRAEHHRAPAELTGWVSRLEYLLASALLRIVGLLSSIRPVDPDRVVLATARVPTLDGNLAYVHAAMRAMHPERRYTLLLEPYSYGLRGRLAYLARLVRGMYHLRTAGLFIVDNAYLPIHVAPHRPGTTVVQLWHAVGALKRFGVDTATPLAEPERTFLHRYYDYVVVPAEGTRAPVRRGAADAGRARARRWVRRGRTSSSTRTAMQAARERLLAAHPGPGRSDGRAVRADLPRARPRQVRGRRPRRGPAPGAPCRPTTRWSSRPTRTSTRPPRRATGYDVVAPPASEMNDWLALADVLVTDYSSSIFEYALLRRPLVLFVPDLDGVRGRPGPVPRLPDRDDRDPGRRHRRGDRRDPRSRRSTRPPGTPSSSAISASRTAARASGSSADSSRRVAPRGGDTLRRDVRHHRSARRLPSRRG